MRAPLVAVPCCRKLIEPHPFHVVGEKYINALTAAAGVLPVLVPALGGALPVTSLLGRVDGLMLTGSPSNVEPHHYDGPPARDGTERDPHRDATTLPLVRAAVAAGMPILAVCRGFQEVNVALGGSLHQHVHEGDGMHDHREPATGSLEQRYAPAHPVALTPGGLLAGLVGADRAQVNSLHGQAVDRLADGLIVEATADDGLVEAFRLAGDGRYLLGVQWHPEWRVLDDALSTAIFRSFGNACRDYATRERHEHHPQMV